ncbi:MAG TPA: phosphoribosyl-AMP cyclohydrolase [Candidatus Nanoarchaeia archaeon]|nr:phosphoribosyl-AMP cyclohydrolase [Candidatus Nanoarchaeia archaeon]
MINFEKLNGLVPVITQDYKTNEVLMLAFMNKKAFETTLKEGKACYFSRSRKKLWRKGEESGHIQKVRGIYVDCDSDAILLKVEQIGNAACHTGYKSCFHRKMEKGKLKTIGKKVFNPKAVYK